MQQQQAARFVAAVLVVVVVTVSLLVVPAHGGAYVLDWEAKGSAFFDKFDFITDDDPTNGFVNYVNQSYAQAKGLISVGSSGKVKLSTDTTNVVAGGSRGRDSVRLESKTLFSGGLFIADVEHVPTGCGTWPSWWLYGPNDYPNDGEIDIIEGVNTQTQDASTLHTNAGCTMTSAWQNASAVMTGEVTEGGANCEVTDTTTGCGVYTPADSYGVPFNDASGGVYILEWATTHLKMWYFARSKIPSDVKRGWPNPAGWGMPYAFFALGAECPATHFRNNTMTINLTFCGDWAGSVWADEADCKNLAATCNDFVSQNPSAFEDAYWLFNSVRVYQWSASASVPSSASRVTAPLQWLAPDLAL